MFMPGSCFPWVTPSQWLSPAGLHTQIPSCKIEDPSMGDFGLRAPSQPECKLPYNWATVWDFLSTHQPNFPLSFPGVTPAPWSKGFSTSSSSLPALLPSQAFPSWTSYTPNPRLVSASQRTQMQYPQAIISKLVFYSKRFLTNIL